MATAHLTVTNGSGGGDFTVPTIVYIYANSAPTGYHFYFWGYGGGFSMGGSLPNSPNTYGYLTANGWATVVYAINTYTINYVAGTGGVISGTATQVVDYGESTTNVTAVANSGYTFSKWNDNNTNATRNDSGASNTTYTASFVESTPTITSLGTISGPKNGGTSVEITGTILTGATSVKFGTTEAASFVVNSSVLITAVTPAHALGLVDVSVTTPTGADTLEDAYTFTANTQSNTGSVTPAGAVTNRAETAQKTGGVATTGALSAVRSHDAAAAEAEMGGTVASSGMLFAIQPRPVTIYVPDVQMVLDLPE